MPETNQHNSKPAASTKKIKMVTGMPFGLDPDWRKNILQAIKLALAQVTNETPSSCGASDNLQDKSDLHKNLIVGYESEPSAGGEQLEQHELNQVCDFLRPLSGCMDGG